MKVDSYKIYDDLALVEEAVTVHIVDALFTSVRQDFAEDDETSPKYIPNKPTKTSDFLNDGEDGTSKYLQVKDLKVDLNRLINEVKIKIAPNGGFKSVVKDNTAMIDLSNLPDDITLVYEDGKLTVLSMKDTEGEITPKDVRNKVDKEHRTGSKDKFKVLSDNNYTDEEKEKVEKIRTDGKGEKALLDDGSYGVVCKIDTVNEIAPDENKNVTLKADNIACESGKSVEEELGGKVPWEDGEIVLSHEKAIKTADKSGKEIDLVKSTEEGTEFGDNFDQTIINTAKRLLIKEGDKAYKVAYEEDLEAKLDTKPDGKTNLISEDNQINDEYIQDKYKRKLYYLGTWDAEVGGIFESTEEWNKNDIQHGALLIVENSGKMIPSGTDKTQTVESAEDICAGDLLAYLNGGWKHFNTGNLVFSVNGKKGEVELDLYEDLGYKAPKLNTDNEESLNPEKEENVEDTLNLHKISKTGKIKDAVDYNNINESLHLNSIEDAVITGDAWMLPYSLIGKPKINGGVSLFGTVNFTDIVFSGLSDLVFEGVVFNNGEENIVMKMKVTSPSRLKEYQTKATGNNPNNVTYAWETVVSIGKDDETADVVWVPVINMSNNVNTSTMFLNGSGIYSQVSHNDLLDNKAEDLHPISAIINLREELNQLSNRIGALEKK